MYSDREKKDMCDAWVQSDGVARRAAHIYAVQWPQRHHPDYRTFVRVNNNLNKHGAVKTPRSIRKVRPVRDDIEKRLDVVLCSQHSQQVVLGTGTMAVSAMTEVSKRTTQLF